MSECIETWNEDSYEEGQALLKKGEKWKRWPNVSSEP
jgi:hypothetical protein